MSHGFYVYGILSLPVERDLDIEGLDKKTVKLEIIDDFALLYSEAIKKRYLASRKNLLGHERVLEEAMATGYPNLLPLQFGMVVPEIKIVCEQLIEPYREELKSILERLNGKREVGIKIIWDSKAEIQTILAQDSELKAFRDSLLGQNLSMEQTIQIGAAIEQRLETRQEKIIQVFQKQLNNLALEVVENEPQTKEMIYNAAYLIAWDEESEFSAQVERLDRQFEGRLRIRYNSFTAPFNFARLESKTNLAA